MIQLRVHMADTPRTSWLEVDGKKVEGPIYVVAGQQGNSFSVSISGDLGKGVEIVKEESESPIS